MTTQLRTFVSCETNGMIEHLSNTLIYIDANVFIYALAEHPAYSRPARELIAAINAGHLRGVTSELKYLFFRCGRTITSWLQRMHSS